MITLAIDNPPPLSSFTYVQKTPQHPLGSKLTREALTMQCYSLYRLLFMLSYHNRYVSVSIGLFRMLHTNSSGVVPVVFVYNYQGFLGFFTSSFATRI